LLLVSIVALVATCHVLRGTLPIYRSANHERFFRFFTGVQPELLRRTDEFLLARGVNGHALSGTEMRRTDMTYRMHGNDRATIYLTSVVSGKPIVRAQLDYRFGLGAWWFSSGILEVEGAESSVDKDTAKDSFLAPALTSTDY
jgi:hypothetical protein